MTTTVRAQCIGVFLMASFAVLALCGLGTRMMAQTTMASITGAVTDGSGASVPDATVTGTEESSGFTRSIVTGADGRFTLSALPMGTYTVRVERTGFKKYERAGFGPLGAGQVARLDVTMVLGPVAETVMVTGVAPLLETETSAVRTPISQDQIQSLPLNSRNPVQLILRQPGAKISSQAGGVITGSYMGFNFNGQNTNGNSFLTDGTDSSVVADNTMTITGGNLITASVDSIAEFDLGTGNYTAEAKGAGGYVNVVTKSGTNKFHGSLFEFWRNDILNARNFFAAKRPSLRLNDFGGTVTGPIQKDKTFFMGSWEGQRIRRPATVHTTVPTADFRETVDARLQPFLDVTPLPTSEIAGNTTVGWYDRAAANATRQDLITGRIDHVFSAKDSMFGRYTINDLAMIYNDAFPSFVTVRSARHQYMTLAETHLFTPGLLNTLRLGGVRFNQIRNSTRIGGVFGLGGISVPGMAISGSETFVQFPHTSFTIADDLIWTKGRHMLKFGVSLWAALYGRNQWVPYAFAFPSASAFALDQPSSVSSTFGIDKLMPPNHYSNLQESFFVQDDFRVTPNLTINWGLRYDNFGLQKESQGRALNVILDPLGAYRSAADPLYERNNKDFGPRIGFAWQPFHSKRTVIRGGYGVYWGGAGSLEETILLTLNLSTPFSVTRTDNPTLAYPLDLSTLTYAAQTPGRYIVDPRASDFSSQQWSLGTEYQVSDSTILRATYVGNHGVHLPGSAMPNAYDPLLGRRPSLTIGNVYEQIRQYSTTYNALQLSYRRRLARGLGLNVYYNWSHAIGIESGKYEISSGLGTSNEQIQSLKLRNLSRGNLAFDERHNLSIDYHYEFPRHGYSSGLADKLLNGWGVAGLATITSGRPFNITTGGNTGDARYVQRPDLVPGIAAIISDVSPADGFLDRAAFSTPTQVNPITGEILGNLGTNVLHGRRFFTTDFGLVKATKIGEGLTAEFRFEFFNLTNHANFADPQTSLTSSIFGRSTSTIGDAREGQFALKLVF